MASSLGLRSGHIEIIKELGGGKVLIRCDCGQEKEVYKSNIMRGNQHSCGGKDCPYHKTGRKLESISNDITGKRFGQLTVLKELGQGKVLVKCDCGVQKEMWKASLTKGQVVSCGHLGKMYPGAKLDLLGERFGSLTVLEPASNGNVIVQCDCGKKLEVSRRSLIEGLANSCGCKRKEYQFATSIDRYGDIGRRAMNPRQLWQVELLDYIASILPSETIEHNVKRFNSVGEIDAYLPNKKIGIEFNGVYWHCSLNKDKKYHQNKSLACMKQGIRLIHIYEYEWKNPEYRDKIKQYLNNILVENKQVLYARKLKLVKLSKEDEKAFFDANHLQGYSSSNICYGLCTDDKVISAMSFGKPRFKQNAEWEIIRYCNAQNIMVVGGAERLFTRFIHSTVPESIQTYASLDKFFGDVYLRLGFKLTGKVTEPGYTWVEDNTYKTLSRYQTMKKDLVQKGLGTDEQTEDEIMYNLGYYKVYNSGNLNYMWKAIK